MQASASDFSSDRLFITIPPIIRRITTTAIPITTGRVTTGIIVTGGTVIVDD